MLAVSLAQIKPLSNRQAFIRLAQLTPFFQSLQLPPHFAPLPPLSSGQKPQAQVSPFPQAAAPHQITPVIYCAQSVPFRVAIKPFSFLPALALWPLRVSAFALVYPCSPFSKSRPPAFLPFLVSGSHRHSWVFSAGSGQHPSKSVCFSLYLRGVPEVKL